MSWSIVSADAIDIALSCARGCYQSALINGKEALSGSTLRGKAARFGGRYKRSGVNLMDRMRRSGLCVDVQVAAHGKRVLVVSR